MEWVEEVASELLPEFITCPLCGEVIDTIDADNTYMLFEDGLYYLSRECLNELKIDWGLEDDCYTIVNLKMDHRCKTLSSILKQAPEMIDGNNSNIYIKQANKDKFFLYQKEEDFISICYAVIRIGEDNKHYDKSKTIESF